MHRWKFLTSDGEEIVGTDSFPSDNLKDKAKKFTFSIDDMPELVFDIPTGCKPVLIRRNRLDFATTGAISNRFLYIVGYKGAEKKLLKIESGTITTIESDGRN